MAVEAAPSGKPFLIIQLRPENETADNELEAIKRYGGLRDKETVRARVETNGLPNVDLNDYAGIIVGGSPRTSSPVAKPGHARGLRFSNSSMP